MIALFFLVRQRPAILHSDSITQLLVHGDKQQFEPTSVYMVLLGGYVHWILVLPVDEHPQLKPQGRDPY